MIKKINDFLDYFKYLGNPIQCLLFKFGIKKEVMLKFKNTDKTVKITKEKLLNRLMEMMPFLDTISNEYIEFISELDSNKEIISWAGVNIINFMEIDVDYSNYPFFEYYFDDYYESFDINYENRCVIDIGSFVGDTALIFAKNGAKVYGYEPVKKNYNYSLKFKEVNPNIKNKLHFFNMGVSDKIGKINIESMDSTNTFKKENDSYEVDVTTIEKILEENNIEPDILKIDCEGCEFNIILNSDLSNFNHIIMEHHAKFVGKPHTLLINKLKDQGFKIKELSIENQKFDEFGLIFAYKP